MAKNKKEKKPFNETVFGKIVNGVKDHAPNVLGLAAKVASGNVSGAISDVVKSLKGKEHLPEVKTALNDLFIKQKEIELEFERVELEEFKAILGDKASARNREVEIAKTGRTDWFMYFVGFVGLAIFGLVVYSIIFLEVKAENKELFIHLVGIVEGIILSIFTFYYGASKKSD